MKERITWTSRTGMGRAGWDGHVNGRRLFSIEMSPSRRGKWVVRTSLPFIIKSGMDLNESSDELKILSERILVTFVRSLGADWKEN